MKITVKGKEYELEDLHITGNCAEEREVTTTMVDADNYMRIYTSIDSWFTKIKKCMAANPEWKIVNLMFRKDGTLSGVSVEAPKRCFGLRVGLEQKRAPLTEEQKAARIETLKKTWFVRDSSRDSSQDDSDDVVTD